MVPHVLNPGLPPMSRTNRAMISGSNRPAARDFLRQTDTAHEVETAQVSDEITPDQINRTKTLAARLKATLAQKQPSARDLEFQRQTVRRHYLSLIFGSNGIKTVRDDESKSAYQQQYALEILNLLWLDTTHAFINLHRRQITQIEKSIKEAQENGQSHHRRRRQKHHQDHYDGSSSSSPPPPGPVARRKVVQKFRSFLNAEDEFWKSLINRLVVTFNIQNAENFLKLLKISPSNILVDSPQENPEVDGNRVDLNHLNSSSHPTDISAPEPLLNLNDHPTVSDRPTKSNVELPLGKFMVHKALICFGDLTRYKELYAQSTSRTDLNSDESNQAKSHRFSRPQQSNKLPNERDWSKAYECYNQARLLLPTNGNPSNQLAVISSYIPDNLSSAYHYYRALSVKDPFPTAGQNLRLTFTKALNKWAEPTSGTNPNQDNVVARFQVEFVALHSMLYTQNMVDLVNPTNLSVCTLLSQSLQERCLPTELILKVAVMAMAAVWHVRVNRKMKPTVTMSDHQPEDREVVTPLAIELATTTHLVDLFTTFLKVAIDELLSTTVATNERDLSLNISAVLRRILPVLRLISKWVLGESEREEFREIVDDFQARFEQFVGIVHSQFPIDQLPTLAPDMWLEEDLDMTGFLPLQKGMSVKSRIVGGPVNTRSSELMVDKTVHPNEEYLMRLGDIQRDVHFINASNHSALLSKPNGPMTEPPVQLCGTEQGPMDGEEEEDDLPVFTPLNNQFSPVRPPTADVALELEHSEDDMDDEDPVDLAMRAVVAHQMCQDGIDNHDTDMDDWPNGDQYDLDEDEVVYQPTNVVTPPRTTHLSNQVLSGGLPGQPFATTQAIGQPISPSERRISPPGSGGLTTAADLLAAITSKAKPSQSVNEIQPAIPSAVLPASPNGWPSLSTATHFHALHNAQTPSNGSMTHIGRRAPSISLPRPAQSGIHTNIWANFPNPAATELDPSTTQEVLFSGSHLIHKALGSQLWSIPHQSDHQYPSDQMFWERSGIPHGETRSNEFVPFPINTPQSSMAYQFAQNHA